MKIKVTEIHDYKEAIQYIKDASSGMDKVLGGLYDLLDELEMVGFVYCDEVQ